MDFMARYGKIWQDMASVGGFLCAALCCPVGRLCYGMEATTAAIPLELVLSQSQVCRASRLHRTQRNCDEINESIHNYTILYVFNMNNVNQIESVGFSWHSMRRNLRWCLPTNPTWCSMKEMPCLIFSPSLLRILWLWMPTPCQGLTMSHRAFQIHFSQQMLIQQCCQSCIKLPGLQTLVDYNEYAMGTFAVSGRVLQMDLRTLLSSIHSPLETSLLHCFQPLFRQTMSPVILLVTFFALDVMHNWIISSWHLYLSDSSGSFM